MKLAKKRKERGKTQKRACVNSEKIIDSASQILRIGWETMMEKYLNDIESVFNCGLIW